MIGLVLVIIASLLWALDTLIRYPLLFSGISAFQIVFLEHVFLFLVVTPLLWKSRRKILESKISHFIPFLLVGGLGSAMATLAFTEAFFLVNPSLVILLQKLQPLIAIILAAIVLKEPIQKKFIFWALLCLVGCLLVTYQDIWKGLSEISSWREITTVKGFKGYGFALIAVFGWGSATVFGKKLSNEGYNAMEIMAGRFSVGLFSLLIFSSIIIIPSMGITKYINQFDLPYEVYLKILAMVLISGIVALYFYYKGLKSIPARLCTLAEMFFPLFAVGINWVFLDKGLEVVQIVGGCFLIIGSSIIQLKKY